MPCTFFSSSLYGTVQVIKVAKLKGLTAYRSDMGNHSQPLLQYVPPPSKSCKTTTSSTRFQNRTQLKFCRSMLEFPFYLLKKMETVISLSFSSFHEIHPKLHEYMCFIGLLRAAARRRTGLWRRWSTQEQDACR